MYVLLKQGHVFIHGVKKNDRKDIIELDGAHSRNSLIGRPHFSNYIANG